MARPLFHIRKKVFGVTQAEMALIAGVSQATISRWEEGRQSPDHDALARIRSRATKRGIPWDDRWFFEAPETAA
jgi:transcriptional regulator with XRE-family HTH domain